jgi:hypothetical protein
VKPIQCEWCPRVDPCRFQWLDDTGLPRQFCSVRCMDSYIRDQVAARRAELAIRQDKTEQDRIE